MQYGACLSAVRRLLGCTGNALQQDCFVVLLFPLLLRNALCGCAVGNLLFYRIEKGFLLFCSAQHPCSAPALRAEHPQGVRRIRRAAKPPTAAQSIRPAQRFLPLAKILSRRRRRSRRDPKKTPPALSRRGLDVLEKFRSVLHASGNDGHLVDRPEKRGFSGTPI